MTKIFRKKEYIPVTKKVWALRDMKHGDLYNEWFDTREEAIVCLSTNRFEGVNVLDLKPIIVEVKEV